MLKEHLYLGVVQYALLHDLRGTKVWLTHNHIYFLAQPRQIVCLLARRVSAAYYSYRLLAIEEPVAGSTATHTATTIGTLRLDAKVFCGSTCCYNHCVRFVFLLVFHYHFLRTDREIYFRHDAGHKLSSETLRLTTHIIHHREGFYTIGITRKILHLCGGSQLSAELRTLDQYR